MSTNFLAFDPSLTNALSDADYLTNSLRSGGAPTDSLLPSPVFNKLAAQVSVGMAALMQAMSNKGYACSDANLSTLTAVMQNIRTSADIPPAMIPVTWASTLTFDGSAATGFDLTLSGNVTSSSLINVFAGELIVFSIHQDGVGARTFAWPPTVKGNGIISAIANSLNLQLFVVLTDLSVHALTPMLSSVGSGIAFTPPGIFSVTSSGNVATGYAEVLEKADASGGAFTRTLFSAIGALGLRVRLKKTDPGPNPDTLATTSGQTIDGQSTGIVTKQNDCIEVISDNANWQVI